MILYSIFQLKATEMHAGEQVNDLPFHAIIIQIVLGLEQGHFKKY